MGSDKFILDTVNNFPETTNDSLPYVRRTLSGVGEWQKLEDSTPITDIVSEQTTQNNRLTDLENDEPANNNIGHL